MPPDCEQLIIDSIHRMGLGEINYFQQFGAIIDIKNIRNNTYCYWHILFVTFRQCCPI